MKSIFWSWTILCVVQEEENTGNVKRELEKVFDFALKATVPNETDVRPLIAACTAKFGDYQWYMNTCGLWLMKFCLEASRIFSIEL